MDDAAGFCVGRFVCDGNVQVGLKEGAKNMSGDQLSVFGILASMLVLFVWGRWPLALPARFSPP